MYINILLICPRKAKSATTVYLKETYFISIFSFFLFFCLKHHQTKPNGCARVKHVNTEYTIIQVLLLNKSNTTLQHNTEGFFELKLKTK